MNRNRAFPFPRLDSTVKVATFLAAMALDAVLVVLLTSSSVPNAMEALNVYAVRSLNNVLFLFYLGIPLLLLLERSPLWPLAPRFVRIAYQKRPRMNLTQRFVVLLTFVVALFVVAFVSISYTGYLLEGVVGFADIVASAYVSGSVLSVVMFIPMLLLLSFIEKRFTRPIEVLTAASRTFAAQVEAHEAGEGPLDVPAIDLQGIHPQLEVADLFESTSKMRADLVDYIDRLARATSERERSRAELDIARQIQQGVVPHEFTSFTERYHLNIDGFMRPAREVGGDFYDVFDVGEQGVAFVVGDVSDKGVPAALFMMRAQSLIREQLLVCRDLGTAFTVVNRMLCDRNDALLFVTAFVCVLDTSTGRVDYVNAGHNPPSLLSEGRRDFLRAKPGLVLGALETASYRTRSIDLKPGDGLVLYTDGATEARDASGALYGEGRLADVLARLDAEGATDVLRRVVGDIDAFAGDEPQADDITLLSFSWNLPVERIVLPPERIEAGDVVEFSAGGETYTGTVVSVVATPLSSEEVRAAAGDWASLNIGGEAWARPVQVEVSAPDGTYDAAVVAESYNPVSLVFGG